MPTTRASKTPLLIACPASHADGVMQVEVDDDSSPLGTAVHSGIAQFIRTGIRPDIHRLAEENLVTDEEELGRLVSVGRTAWDSLSPYFPEPQVEVSMSAKLADDVELTGTCDVLSLAIEDTAAVNDWKSGYRSRDYFIQLQAYALLACMTYGKSRWSVTITWLREGLTDTRNGTLAELMPFKAQLIQALRDRNAEKYRVNSLCEYCPRFTACPARSAIVRSAAADLAGIEGPVTGLRELGPRIIEVYNAIRCVLNSGEKWIEQLRTELDAGGPIAIAPDGSISLKQVEMRELDPEKAWPVMDQHLDQSEIKPAVKVSLSKLLDAVSDKAPRGRKKQAKEAFTADLESAGAINKKIQSRIDVKQPTTA